jgi:outer membrane receptor protein involved in Fe transport
VGAQHQAHSFASVATQYAYEPPNYEQAPWTTYDASMGASKYNWNVELYAQNLTDTRAQLYINGFDWVRLTTPNRPRVIGLHIAYRFKSEKQ